MQGQVYGAAQQLAGQPLATSAAGNANIAQGAAGDTSASQAGQFGTAALSGNAADMAQLQSPYMQQVINAMNAQYGNLSGQMQKQIAEQATLGGAFGGSGYGVAGGVAQSQLALGQAAQIANLLNSGYMNAQGVATNLANMGLGANAQLQNTGQYQIGQAQAAQAHPLSALIAGMQGAPTTTTGTTTQSSNPLSAVLGLLGTAGGAMIGGPAGASLGAQAAGGMLPQLSGYSPAMANQTQSGGGNMLADTGGANLGIMGAGGGV